MHPDLTSDMDSLLASASESTPQIDDIIKEQLADKSENLPDLTGDLNSLLAEADKAEPEPEEPELKPYIPKKAAAVPKIEDEHPANDEILTQNPTETLAEIYMSQGLPQKAVTVYKDLLARDPDNVELKTKLALAEIEI